MNRRNVFFKENRVYYSLLALSLDAVTTTGTIIIIRFIRQIVKTLLKNIPILHIESSLGTRRKFIYFFFFSNSSDQL